MESFLRGGGEEKFWNYPEKIKQLKLALPAKQRPPNHESCNSHVSTLTWKLSSSCG